MTNFMFKAYFWTFVIGGALGLHFGYEMGESKSSTPAICPPAPTSTAHPFTASETALMIKAAQREGKTPSQWVHDTLIVNASSP